MTYLFKLARRTAQLRALPLLALAATLSACDTDSFSPSENPAAAAPEAEPFTPPTALYAESFRGGIPFGTWALPTSEFGSIFNGAMRNIDPNHLRSELAEIKSRGGRVILSLAGKETNYLDGDHHFSLSLWKERVDRFKGVDITSFIEDGTVIGHYIIDEPNDPANWGGRPVPGSMVEQMAAYSKQVWPKMATIVRAEPKYLAETGGSYQALDAAWAQWVARKGAPKDYIERNIADAQRLGLALVTGLNITKGSSIGGELSASLVESAGSTILAQSYPCAFISWEWRDAYMSRSDIKSAMAVLSNKAEAHAARSCMSGGGETPPPPPPSLPGIKGISLTATKAVQGDQNVVTLVWQGAAGSNVRLFVNGTFRRNTVNDGKGFAYPRRSGSYSYKICEVGTTRCSNNASVTIR
jgi:hypothetical protein